MAKKILAFLLVVSLTAAVAIGGTLAYLTDRDSEANVFTVGDVNIDLNEDFNQGATLIPGVDIVKTPTITNEGPNAAYVWATVAVPADLASVINFSTKGDGWADWTRGTETVTINGKDFVLYTALYNTALTNGGATTALFEKVSLNSTVDIDPNGQWHTVVNGTATDLGWNSADGNPVIYVSAYAIQTEGFSSVQDAYAAYNAQWGNNGTEYSDPIPADATIVKTADALITALNGAEDGAVIALNNDIAVDADSTITIPAGKSVTLNLNGKTLSGTADGTGNREMMLVKGNLTVTNGKLEMDATVNEGWNSMTAIFDVTDGGVLTLDGVTAVNEGGTDMNFVVHLNNWGEVTLNVNNSTLKATYIPVRVFNSGPNMNHVTIENSTLEGKYCFWVHNYTEADFGTAEKANAQKALLDLSIIGNGNTFNNSGKAPLLFGFTDTVYQDADGNPLS